MPLTSGTRLGPFEIVAPLGAGGMGDVYRARDVRLGREVAIKAVSQEFARDPDLLARFEREARLLASLNHPNIAAIYGLEESAGVPYLVLELVHGESLAERLKRGPVDVRSALALAAQIAAAVEAAHERGIVHRDLKPANVMLDTTGSAKVLDFGIAKSAENPAGRPSADGTGPAAGSDGGGPSQAGPGTTPSGPSSPDAVTLLDSSGGTIPGTILGTAAYMSPEQARGQPVDRRSDVWSFGCILYECLTGRAPFEGATASDLIARILERTPDWQALPAGVPSPVRDLLMRCLRKNAGERPRDIRDVRLALVEHLSSGPKSEAAAERSIVVLPFAHAPGTDDEYFADGVTEEILNALAHVEGLRVAARTSSFVFKGRGQDLRQIAEALNVTTVLEGSVRRSGNRLRITAQLVNTADGYQLWSERYDRELTDVFEVQDEIANTIAAKLKLTLGTRTERPAARGTNSLEAYDLFLKGRAILYRRGRYILDALADFEKALALDPNYAEALAWMADCYRLQGTFGTAAPDGVMQKAKEAAERALSIDPNLAEAHATLADIESQYEHAWDRATRSWERALALDPRHTRARCERALWSLGFGGFSSAEATDYVERAVADDPLNAWALAMLSMQYGMADRHEESLAAARRAVEVDASNYFAQWNFVRAHAWMGDNARAIELGRELLMTSGRHSWTLVALIQAWRSLGEEMKARALYDELEARSRSEFISPAWLGCGAAAMGLLDQALVFVSRAVDERDPFTLLLRVMPYWRPVRDRPEFQALIPRVGLR